MVYTNRGKKHNVEKQNINYMAIHSYNVDPKCYKNKRLLLQEFINIWNDYFYNNPEFKKSYEEHYGTTIYL